RQDLLALPGAQLSEIKTVISHQQALAQSGPFLKLHHFATKAWGNTADAARYVAEQGDQTLAAIASAETAKLYGLQILAEGVNEDGDNTTRFIVIEKEGAQRQPIAAAPGQRLSMLFTVDHKPGRLARTGLRGRAEERPRRGDGRDHGAARVPCRHHRRSVARPPAAGRR
ncbi:chorismate mutase/prephenate dehydratase, partial [human gut metagenome]